MKCLVWKNKHKYIIVYKRQTVFQKETYNGPTCVLIMVNLGFIDALHEMRVVVQQHYENKWYGLGWAAIALGMVIGLLAAVYLIYYLFMRICFPHLYRVRWIPGGKQGTGTSWRRETRKPFRPYIRVLLGAFLIIGCIFSIWIAFNIAGYNYVSSPINQLIITGLASYMFASALRNFGSGFWNNIEDKLEENWYVELPQYGPKVRGYIKEKHGQFVELHYVNERGFMVDVQVPNTVMSEGIVIREHEYEIPTAEGGRLQQLYKHDQQVKYDLDQAAQQRDIVLNMEPRKMK